MHFPHSIAAIALVLSMAGALCASEPIDRLPATEASVQLASLVPGPRVGGQMDSAGIWPADDAAYHWRLNPLGTELLPNPPPLIGPTRNMPTYPEGFTDPEIIHPNDKPPPRHVWPYKSGFFQKFGFIGGWIPDAGSNGQEIAEFKTFLTVALPLPTSDFPLLITPNFEMRLLDGPKTPDFPARVYNATAQFMWVPKISERLLGVLMIEPGVYSDFDHYDPAAWRTLGRAILRYDWIPDRLQIGGGVLYLDRDDYPWLPVGGVIWMPIDDIRLEIIFPQPRAAYRLGWNGRREDWVYLAGDIGGDSYAITRVSGAREKAALFDLRVLLGVERQFNGGAGAKFEVGYVFNRKIDYFATGSDLDLNPTFIVRAGFSL